MVDLTRHAPEGETPVNPYSLLEAVNNSSQTAHTAWLIFLGVMAYLTIAVAGVTHKDLLLETPVSLPILQVDIQLRQFFQFAPVVLVLMHVGLVSQLALLARETLEFDSAIGLIEATDKRTHPLRLELNNFFFVQAIAGPHRSRVMSAFLYGMSWLTLVVLPVLLLLYLQVVFLPYHDAGITWVQRAALIADIAMLVCIGVFLLRAEASFPQALMRSTRAHPISFVMTVLVLLFVGLFSFFFATVPGEALDRVTQRTLGLDGTGEGRRWPRLVQGYAVPFIASETDGTLLGVFKRNLDVTDTDLVLDSAQRPGEPSLNLRGRDLRFAKLDRSDLHQADFTGADLTGASLVGADLRGAWLQCADFMRLVLASDRDGAECTRARRAVFTRARLDGAHLSGVDLAGATLDEARLEGATLAYALMPGANLSSADLDKADLTGGVEAQGANFLMASLQGADLTGAKLLGADFSNADLMGAVMRFAGLDLANLKNAKLDGAVLYRASLIGADLSGASTAGTDLREAKVWRTVPPSADPAGLADLTGLAIAQVTDGDAAAIKDLLARVQSWRVRRALSDKVEAIGDLKAGGRWSSTADYRAWQGLASLGTRWDQDVYRVSITDYLVQLICRPRWSDGAVATGIARRAQRQEFRGDLTQIYTRLKSSSCPASEAVAPKVLKDLSTAIDVAQGG